MTLTVRLPDPLDRALELYCAERGVTKSHVVQECLAAYLVGQEGARPSARVSGNFEAFRRAGALGAVNQPGPSATKDAVRERAAARGRRKP